MKLQTFLSFVLLSGVCIAQTPTRPVVPNASTLASKTSQIAAWYKWAVHVEAQLEVIRAEEAAKQALLQAQLNEAKEIRDEIRKNLQEISGYIGGVQVQITAKSSLILSWKDNSSNEAGFNVECMLPGASTFTKIGTTGPNVTTFTHADLAPGSYTYRVNAFNRAGISGFTPPVSGLVSVITNQNKP